MTEPCELFNIIPREKLNALFEKCPKASAEMDFTFLGFEDVYKAVTLFVPKGATIIDLGCAYATQSWYFREHRRYIGVDVEMTQDSVLRTENSEFYHMTIQKFITDIFPILEIPKEEVFAICSYVTDESAQKMVRENFPYCLVYYPTRRILNET